MLIVLVLCTLLAGTALAQAPTTKQVGLVIAFPDGTEHLEIVTVPSYSATTFDVLQKAKITLASADSGFGPGVCGINTSAARQRTASAMPPIIGLTMTWMPRPANGLLQPWVWAASFPPTAPSLASPGADSMQSYNPTVQPPVYTFAQIVAKTTPPPVSVPEPGTILLLGSGLAGVAAYVRLRKSR